MIERSVASAAPPHDVAETHYTEQPPSPWRHDIRVLDVVQRILVAVPHHGVDHLACARGRGQRHELLHHEPARRFRIIADELTRAVGLFRIEKLEDRLGFLGVEVGEDVGLFIARELGDDRRRLVGRQEIDELGGLQIRNFFDQVGRRLGRQLTQQQLALARRQARQRAQQLADGQRIDERAENLGIALFEKLLDGFPGGNSLACHVRPLLDRHRRVAAWAGCIEPVLAPISSRRQDHSDRGASDLAARIG